MAGETPEFPDGDAWTDHMPDVRTGFASSSSKKSPVVGTPGEATPAASTANDEYKTFASLDLSNIGR